VGTQLLYFLIVNTAKVPTYAWLGTINGATLRDSIWFLPLLPLGTLSGAWLGRRIPDRPFVITLYVVAVVTAGHMLWQAVRG
jgi:uncharacterized membrane protein YfcA